VVILQHPREARLAICSARLARLALENAELHRGVSFEGHARVTDLVRTPGAVLLFPGAETTPAGALAGSPPPVLFAVDGTWHQAEKMIRLSPSLAALPRVSVDAGRPSGYTGLRAEPGEVHLSTLEAVAIALGALEDDAARFEPMIAAFHRSVALQLAAARGERRNPRHKGDAWRLRSAGPQHEQQRADHPGEAEGGIEQAGEDRLPARHRP
jgi:DTW domain-containing protein